MVDPTARDARVDAGEVDSLVERLKQENEVMRLEVIEARHSLLVNRDHVVGTEAEIGRLNRDVLRLHQELVASRKRISALQKRKNGLVARNEDLQAKLAAVRSRADRLRAELDSRAPSGVPLSRRIARRLRGGPR